MSNPLPSPSLPTQPPAPQSPKPAPLTPASPASQPSPASPPAPHLPIASHSNLAPNPPRAAIGTSAPLPMGVKAPAQATPAGSSDKPPAPKMAKISKSSLRFLPLILGGLLLLGVIGLGIWKFFLSGNNSSSVAVDSGSGAVAPAKQQILSYWGLWEPNEVLSQVLDDFSKDHPGVIVEYKKQSPTEYRERLQSAILAGTGPDLFRFHATWTPMLKAELDPMPSSVMKPAEYAQIFYPVAVKQLSQDGKIVGIPLMYDGLALFYNQKALTTANIALPKSWSEFKTAAKKLTIRSSTGISRAGAAMGTSSNVDHFSDILALLLLQNGTDLAAPNSDVGAQALEFYTDFATQDQVWDESFPNSTSAFARGDVAMILAPSWEAHEIMAQNPDLEFGIAPTPKLAETELNWASFWAEGVNTKSKNKAMAWELLKYLSSAEVEQKLYSSAKQIRSFGEIYSRQDLAKELISDQFASAFLQEAPKATSWYMCSATHDNGLNDQIISYYSDAVTSVVKKSQTPVEAMSTVGLGVKSVLGQYQVNSL